MEDILSKNYNKLFYFLLSIVKNHWEAEDILQDVMVKILKNINKVREMEKIDNWMFRIAKNTAINYLRRKKILQFVGIDKVYEADLADNDSMPHQAAETRDDREMITEYLDELKENYRMIVYLKIYEDKTFREIAQIMGKGESTIKTLYYKSLNILKAKVEKVHGKAS